MYLYNVGVVRMYLYNVGVAHMYLYNMVYLVVVAVSNVHSHWLEGHPEPFTVRLNVYGRDGH